MVSLEVEKGMTKLQVTPRRGTKSVVKGEGLDWRINVLEGVYENLVSAHAAPQDAP